MYRCKECKHFRRCTRAQTLYVFSNAPTVYYCDHFKQRRVSRINWAFVLTYTASAAISISLIVWLIKKILGEG